MDFYMHMIWPQETLLQIIIIFLLAVVALVVMRCMALYRKIRSNIRTIESLGNSTDLNGIAYLENSLKLNNVNYETTFEQFETNNQRTIDNAPVFEHIKTIYDAGRKSSRLDADLLVKNTIDKVCTGVDTIKSCISVFLVIGILGTLLGLGLSIGSFNGDSFIVTAQANNTAQELSKLFGNLRGAFAPSMWGVFMTIIFVIFYTIIIQEIGINQLTDRLTANTLKVWLPALYPTDFQKGENTMVKLKETVQNAEDINNGVKDLQKNLVEANETVEAMNGMASAVSSSAEKIASSSDKLVAMQEAVEKLSGQIKEQNQHTTEWLSNAVAQISNYQNQGHEKLMQQADAVNANFAAQSSQLNDIVRSLKKYDENVLQTQDKLEKNLQMAASLGNPIKDSLVDMTKQLGTIGTNLDKIDNPLNQSAQKIQTMFGHMLTTMQENNKMLVESITAQGGLPTEAVEALTKAANANNVGNNTEILAKIDTLISTLKNQQENISAPVNDDIPSASVKDMLRKMDTMISALKNHQVTAFGGESKGSEPIVIEQPKPTVLGKLAQIMPIAIAVLLAISIGVQCWMVKSIGDLQQSQNTVNEILLKGDKIGN